MNTARSSIAPVESRVATSEHPSIPALLRERPANDTSPEVSARPSRPATHAPPTSAPPRSVFRPPPTSDSPSGVYAVVSVKPLRPPPRDLVNAVRRWSQRERVTEVPVPIERATLTHAPSTPAVASAAVSAPAPAVAPAAARVSVRAADPEDAADARLLWSLLVAALAGVIFAVFAHLNVHPH